MNSTYKATYSLLFLVKGSQECFGEKDWVSLAELNETNVQSNSCKDTMLVMALVEFSPGNYQEHSPALFSLMSKVTKPGLVRPGIPATGRSRVQCKPRLQKISRVPSALVNETLLSK